MITYGKHLLPHPICSGHAMPSAAGTVVSELGQLLSAVLGTQAALAPPARYRHQKAHYYISKTHLQNWAAG